MSDQPLLTRDGIERRLSATHARRPGPSILLNALLADRGGVALLAEWVECMIANTAVQHGLRIEVSAEGWRVNSGAAWATLEEAITGRAAVKPAPQPAASAPAVRSADDDDEPLPF